MDKKNKKGKPLSGKPSKYTVSQLLDKADDCLDSFDYDVAVKFCKRAFDVDPTDLRVLETYGYVQLELGNVGEADKLYRRAVTLSPDSGHSKYMYLGQLSEGHDAVANFRKGVEILLKEREEKRQEGAEPSANESERNRKISNSYCSLAELYLTDLCYEDDADVKCKNYTEKAVDIDPNNSEAYRILADCLMSLEDTEGAREMIKKSVSMWLGDVKTNESISTPTEDGESAPAPSVKVTSVPYESRVNSAKILIELQEFQMATEVLNLLQDENDSVTQVWYLLGWMNYLQGDDWHKDEARTYLSKAQKVYAASGDCDIQIMDHIAELLEELGPGDGGSDEDAESDVNFDESTDNSEEEEEMEES